MIRRSLWLLASLPLLATAQPLPDIVRQTLASHPLVEAADRQVNAREAAVSASEAALHPQVGVAAELGRSSLQTPGPFPASGARWPNTLSLLVSQPIYTGGALQGSVDVARLSVDSSRQHLQRTRVDVAIQAIAAYAAVVRDQALLSLYQQSLQTLQQAAQEADKRFRVGENTRTDVAQAQARAAEGQARVAQAEATLAISRAEFQRVTGQPADDLDTRLPDLPMPASLAEAQSKAEQQSPVLGELRGQAAAADRAIAIAEAGRKPQVSVEARASTQDNTEFGYDRLSTWGVYVKAQMPLYESGRTDAHTRQARAESAASQAALADASAGVHQQLTAAWLRWQAAQATLPALQASVEAASLARDSLRTEVRVGTRTTLELLNAEQELLAARVNLLLRDQERSLAAYEVLAVIGDLSVLTRAQNDH